MILLTLASTIITNPFLFCTCSETEEDHSHSEGVDDNELIADGMEMVEEEYDDVEEGCE